MATHPPRTPFGRRALLALAVSAGVLASAPHAAHASSNDDDVEHYDARVLGYSPEAEAKSSSVGLTYVLVVLLGAGCVGVLFMNPRRSHLD